MEERWTAARFLKYVNAGGFANESDKMDVFNEVRTAEILQTFLDTVEGKIICNSVINAMTLQVRNIIRLSIEGFDQNREAIKQAALQIDIAHKFLMGLVDYLATGKSHEERSKHLEELERAGLR